MRVEPIKLHNTSNLIKQYRENDESIMQYFDYSPFHSYGQRVKDLQKRSFRREQLAETLHAMNEEWGAPTSTFENIERLKQDNSVVVIGGQQAGLLTGPLYTINKVISIIQFARKQEAELNIPVIPVFWIAGEDHDYDEVNHVYTQNQTKIKKVTLAQQVDEKQPVSSIKLEEKHMNKWLNQLFTQLNETQHTKTLYDEIKRCLHESKSMVDFFARVIFQLFKEEGLVLMDSNDTRIRSYESEYFELMIEKQPDIAKAVYQTYHSLKQSGYAIDLEPEEDDAHLFYLHENERILLKRETKDLWVGKQNEVELSTDELLEAARKSPCLLSNNVVTRPIMQELVFPTLAFIGGNGEISYWAVLKKAFHSLDLQVPPVLPRLSFTYVDYALQKRLAKLTISMEHAILNGVDDLKVNWLASHANPPIDAITEQVKLSIEKLHQPLQEIAGDIRADLSGLAKKNLAYLHKEVDFLKQQMLRALEEKYANEIKSFDMISNQLHPLGVLQERIWSPLEWMNNYGFEFMKPLIDVDCSFEEEHYVVYI
ncbi:bacillithiol biosynthesis cysteine-adding enzyme BshC [Ornithinibacillus sp. 4-3]|uniref:Putative cysteine ligase BshC n=1 Tax=Ornithinibacillus sp. 4-3 TaxID=3231488 RepID=A0AB39HV26_9BACI